ncbi:MAG: hypothetical protein VX473_02115 [Candidatus Thermoplasmatota archaeon]|nr:hypothetical protein [Candidatus Thermoplasmatota archaeon]
MQAKKSKHPWSATITTSSGNSTALAASLACEEVDVTIVDDVLHVTLAGSSASDLRAKFNSTSRSLRAASESLTSILR